jgi:hypothetical protein
MSSTPPETTEVAKRHDEFEIVVNAEPQTVPSETVTYEQVVRLAYPTPPSPETRFTVTFRNAKEPKQGSLAPGQSVKVKQRGTVFNVKATGKS